MSVNVEDEVKVESSEAENQNKKNLSLKNALQGFSGLYANSSNIGNDNEGRPTAMTNIYDDQKNKPKPQLNKQEVEEMKNLGNTFLYDKKLKIREDLEKKALEASSPKISKLKRDEIDEKFFAQYAESFLSSTLGKESKIKISEEAYHAGTNVVDRKSKIITSKQQPKKQKKLNL